MASCRCCGKTNAQRMVGLMTLWFGSFIDLEPAHGYFYLCPACYRIHVAPHLEDVQEKLARMHPGTAAFLEREHYVRQDDETAPGEVEAPETPDDARARGGTSGSAGPTGPDLGMKAPGEAEPEPGPEPA